MGRYEVFIENSFDVTPRYIEWKKAVTRLLKCFHVPPEDWAMYAVQRVKNLDLLLDRLDDRFDPATQTWEHIETVFDEHFVPTHYSLILLSDLSIVTTRHKYSDFGNVWDAASANTR